MEDLITKINELRKNKKQYLQNPYPFVDEIALLRKLILQDDQSIEQNCHGFELNDEEMSDMMANIRDGEVHINNKYSKAAFIIEILNNRNLDLFDNEYCELLRHNRDLSNYKFKKPK